MNYALLLSCYVRSTQYSPHGENRGIRQLTTDSKQRQALKVRRASQPVKQLSQPISSAVLDPGAFKSVNLMRESDMSQTMGEDDDSKAVDSRSTENREEEDPEPIPAWIRYMPRSLSKSSSAWTSTEALSGVVPPAEPTKLRCSMRLSANRFSTNIALQRINEGREKRKREHDSAESVPEPDETRMRRKKTRGVSVVECEKLLSFAKL